MISGYVTLGLLVALALFVSRALYNYRMRDSETERTKRLDDWLQFRRDRWQHWRIFRDSQPPLKVVPKQEEGEQK